MSYSVERFDTRTWSDDQLETLFAEGFPTFITADAVAKVYIGRVRSWFADQNIMLISADQPVATGWGVPIRWNGEVSDLPAGYTDAIRRAVELRESTGQADTFVICGGIVDPALSRRGLAAELIAALRDLPAAAGLARVIAPVRPTMKAAYPLTPIETFVTWLRDDGLPFDPWLRTHVRVGGRLLATAPHSQTMTGTVEQWETWTGLRLPSTGQYVIPNGLSPLDIDHDADLGTYTEPNIWVQHR
ncbi:MAG: hypothetical protein M3Y35_01945 [Actinomycetota bacterium]|nr:hypothetical protein [Actinomycetota bacterium]